MDTFRLCLCLLFVIITLNLQQKYSFRVQTADVHLQQQLDFSIPLIFIARNSLCDGN